MAAASSLAYDDLVALLRGAAEETRLRILVLLGRMELTVSDLVSVLDQSQPRISRHLKILVDAQLVVRNQEGAWAWFRLAEDPFIRPLIDAIVGSVRADDTSIIADVQKLEALRRSRDERAADYFAANAERWNAIRSLHIREMDVETAILEMGLASRPASILDVGTGTGRMLQLFADHVERGVGIDRSADMLALARSTLGRDQHGHLQVRQGDAYDIPLDDNFDLIVLHQVLHYLEDPQHAIDQAAGRLAGGGRLLIIDFAPHTLDFLRDQHAHRRLGIGDDQMQRWLVQSGLSIIEKRRLQADAQTRDGLTVTLCLAGKND